MRDFLLFAVIWVPVALFITKQVDGWSSLAKSYRCQEPPVGKIHWFESGHVDGFYYRGALKVAPARDGIYLAVVLPFSFLYPPLLIPWNAVHAAYRQTPQDRRIKLIIAAERDIQITLPYRLFDSVSSFLPSIQTGSTSVFQWRSMVVGIILMLLAWGGLWVFVW